MPNRNLTLRGYRDNLTTTPQITPDEQYALARSDENQFLRGLRTGAQGMSAGSFAMDALSREASGDPTWQDPYARALQQQAATERYTPRVQSLADIRGPRDAVDYAAGAVGQGLISMAPTLAAAIATRGRAALPVAYGLERNESALTSYTDPVQSQRSAQDRLNVARGVGLANAGLEAAAPQQIARGALTRQRGLARRALADAATEGGTEAAQTIISGIGQQYLDPAARTEPIEVLDAAVAGALTGGAAGGATRGTARGIEYAAQRLRELNTGADIRQVIRDPTTEAAETVLAGDAAVQPGATVEETMQNLSDADRARAEITREIAESMLSVDTLPAELRAQIEAMQGDYVTPENQAAIATAALREQERNRVSRTVEDLVEQPEIVRENLQDTTPGEQAGFNQLLFDNLSEEARTNETVRARLPEIANTLLAYAARTQDLTRSDVAEVARVRDALDLFADPDAAVQSILEYANLPRDSGSFLSRVKDISNAQEDIRQPNSFLYSSLTEEARNTMTAPEMRELARIVDEFGTTDMDQQSGDAVLRSLTSVFGTEGNARRVLDYYQQLNSPNLMLEPDTNLTTVEAQPQSNYRYAEPRARRPYLALDRITSNQTGERRRVRPSTMEAARLRQQGLDARPVSMAEMVQRTGTEPAVELGRIRRDIESRIKQHQARTNEDRSEQISRLQGELAMLNAVENMNGPESALEMYEVLEVRDQQPNDLVATDDTLSKMANFANARDARNTRVTFRRTDGRPFTLSAESMWREQGNLEGSGRGEPGVRRARRLFNEAAAAVLARDDVAEMVTPIGDIVINRRGNIRAAPASNPQYRALVRQVLSKSEGSLSSLTQTLNSVVDEYTEATDHVDRPISSAQATEGPVNSEYDSRREEIRAIMDANIDNYRARLREISPTSPAGIVARERLRRYEDARRQLDAVDLDEAIDYRDNNREGLPGGAEQTGPVGPNALTRTRSNEELSDPGTRLYDEQTGLSVERSSTQNTDRGVPASEAERRRAVNEIARIRGKSVKVLFTNLLGASGKFTMSANKTKRIIQIAADSTTPTSVAWHESLHDFIAMLDRTPEARNIRNQLYNAASTPWMMRRLRELLKDHPRALKQIEQSREERVAYMYQFWAEGVLPIGQKNNTVFQKLADFFFNTMGVVANDTKTLAYLDALHTGKFADPSTVSRVVRSMGLKTTREKFSAITGPLSAGYEALFVGATDRLRNTNIAALEEIADLFHREPGREEGGLPFLQRRSQEVGKRLNSFQKLLLNTTVEQRTEALRNLQAMKRPSNTLERGLRKYLDDMFVYLTNANVERLDTKTGQWVPIRRVENYFPRVWDKNTIRNNEQEFVALLTKYISPAQAAATVDALLNSDGSMELKDNQHSLGFTPFMSAVENRGMTFINSTNAEQFTKFQDADLVNIMTTYTQQAVHRAEFNQSFGRNGKRLNTLLSQAVKQGATAEQLELARKSVAALEGTLGFDFNPQIKSVMSGIITAQNLALLPLTLFASLVDPIGIAVRTNDFREAGRAFLHGMKGLKDAVLRRGDTDDMADLARTLGIIDEQNMLEAMGYVYNSMHMSKTMRNINNKFFHYNGMELWNQRMRTAALAAGMRFVVKNIDNTRYMDELGITRDDVFEQADGTLALTKDDIMAAMKQRNPRQKAATREQNAEAVERRIQQAMFKFVDGAVLRPNAAHRPIWGSDPRFMLIFHLKQFTYSFHNVINRRVGNELQYNNYAPLWALISYVPFMFASDLARGSLTGTITAGSSVFDAFTRSLARSSALGVHTFGLEAFNDVARGGIPGSDFLGPSFDHAVQLSELIFADGDGRKALLRTIPGGALFRGVL